jgi:lantibiotic modifying enzyme
MKKVSVFCCFLVVALVSFGQTSRPYLEKALQAEKWIRSLRIESPQGTTWPISPGDTSKVMNLYSGSAGVILFYLELFQATQDEQFLEEAKNGADFLLYYLPEKEQGYDEIGLYTGLSGICYTLEKVHEVTKAERFKVGLNRYHQLLMSKAKTVDNVIDWGYTDIVYGASGIGLYLLNSTQHVAAKKGAVKTGRGLLSADLGAKKDSRWYMDTAMVKRDYYMPNFSHGTAGVCYFFTRLYTLTNEKEFLDAALAGANHLEAIENKDAWIYHHDKEDGKDLYYLSWCHGPAGTARLYYELYKTTKDVKWLDKIKRAAQALMVCGIPDKQTSGFWNNVGSCCGSAGVAEFFLELHKIFKDSSYLEFSKQVTANLLQRATQEVDIVFWKQAENRRDPDLLLAQTGYMQGAAGIGMWLLHLDAFENNYKSIIKLPDNSF